MQAGVLGRGLVGDRLLGLLVDYKDPGVHVGQSMTPSVYLFTMAT